MENNLEKEFVPYEEALELKKLGFNEPCFGFYERSKELVIQECEITDFHFDSIQCVAPTFSQAFRWFRDEHNIISVIDFYCDNDYWDDVVYEVRISEFNHFKTHDSFVKSGFKTYEEAELACLKRLIKIANELE